MTGAEERIRGLIHRACDCLDREAWDGFLALCTADFRYRITAHSPELRKPMVWFDHDRESLKALLDMVPQHLRRLGTLLRHVSVGAIDINGGAATAQSTFQIIHTDHDGRSHLLAVGRYHDVIDLGGGNTLLKSRDSRLETRDVGIGSHVPF